MGPGSQNPSLPRVLPGGGEGLMVSCSRGQSRTHAGCPHAGVPHELVLGRWWCVNQYLKSRACGEAEFGVLVHAEPHITPSNCFGLMCTENPVYPLRVLCRAVGFCAGEANRPATARRGLFWALARISSSFCFFIPHIDWIARCLACILHFVCCDSSTCKERRCMTPQSIYIADNTLRTPLDTQRP